MGILLTLTTHWSACSMAARRRAVLAGLPYNLPVKYEVYSKIWVAHQSSSVPNVCSHPSTPDILVPGVRRSDYYKHPPSSFRSCLPLPCWMLSVLRLLLRLVSR